MVRGLGERLATLRYEKGWTQQKVADAVSVDPSTIARIEYGDQNPSVGLLVKLADLYGCTLEYLLNGK